jgi:carbon storage regulator
MFVIRRKAGESVLVGKGIEITVLEITANRVKLGFVAPAEVAVLRSEILLARNQNVAAASTPPDEDQISRWARALLPDSSG